MRVCVCALFKSNTPTITIVKTAVSSNRHTNNNKSKQTTKMCIWTDIRTFRNNCTHSVFDWHDKRTSRTWEGKEVHSWRTQTKEIFSVQLFYTAEPKENKKKTNCNISTQKPVVCREHIFALNVSIECVILLFLRIFYSIPVTLKLKKKSAYFN